LTPDLGPNLPLKGHAGSRAGLNTPALLLDLDEMERNLALGAARAREGGIALRPHAKGSKSVQIARRQRELGAIGTCCTTVGEAEAMIDGGLNDILITSPVVGTEMLARLERLLRLSDGLVVVSDCAEHIAAYSPVAKRARKPLDVLVDFDVGQGRTGVQSVAAGIALGKLIGEHPTLQLSGIQAYYGHLQHVPTLADRKTAVLAQTTRVRELVRAFDDNRLSREIVTGGGTGTFEVDLAEKVFTELQLGSYPFLDREYVEIELAATPRAAMAPSLFVQATVVSANTPGLAIVNAGYKSFATEGGMPLVHSPNLLNARYTLMGDEHGGVAYDIAGPALKVGDKVEFLTPHCDPTINLYDRYHCVRGDVLVDIWPVDARGR
jgi:D-serine deaminase-like pyridoxal phosphate-dependent protein